MNDADDLDTLIDAATKPVKWSVADLVRPDLFNGYYTITFPDGSHKTFRLHTQKGGKLAGKRILSLLIGPDNTSDYEQFAFMDVKEFKVWKRFAGQKQAEYARKLWTLMNGGAIYEHELMTVGHCIKCNRVLSDPESIRTGLGPTCRKGPRVPRRLVFLTSDGGRLDMTPREVMDMEHDFKEYDR